MSTLHIGDCLGTMCIEHPNAKDTQVIGTPESLWELAFILRKEPNQIIIRNLRGVVVTTDCCIDAFIGKFYL